MPLKEDKCLVMRLWSRNRMIKHEFGGPMSNQLVLCSNSQESVRCDKENSGQKGEKHHIKVV